MRYKRIGRALVCLVLVCAIMVNVSPIKAKAFTITATAASVATVIASCALGLGVSFGTYELAEPYLTACADFISLNYDYITDDQKINIWATGNPDLPYVVDAGIVEAVREWMFGSGVVSPGIVEEVSADPGYVYCNGVQMPEFLEIMNTFIEEGYAYAVLSYDNGFTVGFTKGSFVLGGYNGNSYPDYLCIDNPQLDMFYIYKTNFAGEWEQSLHWSNVGYPLGTVTDDALLLVSGCSVTNFEDDSIYSDSFGTISSSATSIIEYPQVSDSALVAYEIAPKDEDFSTGYSEWAAGAVTIPAGTVGITGDITALPIGIGKDLSETISATQADVWAGVSTYTGASTDTDTDADVVVPDIPAISAALGDTSTSVFLNALADTIETLPLIPTHIEDAIEQLPAYVSDIRDYIETLPEWQDVITDHIEQLPGQIADIRDFIETLPEWQDSLLDHIEILPDRFSTAFDAVKTGIGTIADTLTGSITGTLTDIQAIGVDIGTKVQAIPDVIAKAISDAKAAVVEAVEKVVVPEKDYLTSKVNALREEFAFADSIVRTGEALQLGLTGISTTPPVITSIWETPKVPITLAVRFLS